MAPGDRVRILPSRQHDRGGMLATVLELQPPQVVLIFDEGEWRYAWFDEDEIEAVPTTDGGREPVTKG
jgi:hypothetical protein